MSGTSPLSPEIYSLFRTLYGVLLFGTLVSIQPHAGRFFLSEKWGGYAKSSPDVDTVQNPAALPFVLLIWFSSAVLLIANQWTLVAAAINLALCRYFFIAMRWKGVSRGLGAPGFISYWLAAAVFILELTFRMSGQTAALSLMVLQTDFAFIMLSSGIYKIASGYPRNNGMEFGMVNPQWGYGWSFISKLKPSNPFFYFCNQMAWIVQTGASLCLFVPGLKPVGGYLLMGSFAWIATQIRLGLLCEMVMAGCLLFITAGVPGESWFAALASHLPAAQEYPPVLFPAAVIPLIHGLLWLYLALLPLVYGGLALNFYAKKRLSGPIQKWLEVYTNFFGIILWRVFSVDLVNFFVRIYRAPASDISSRLLLTRFGWRGGLRYSHVGEMITLTCLFTTRKYYPSQRALFEERLIRYAKTVPSAEDDVLIFQSVVIHKSPAAFQFIPAAEYIVNTRQGTIVERILDSTQDITRAHPGSPIHEGLKPGSYAPLETARPGGPK